MILTFEINEKEVYNYIIMKYLNNLNDDEVKRIKNSIRIYDNNFEPGIIGNNDNFRTFIPRIKTINDALITVHELLHAISLIKGNENYITDEILPMEGEIIFLKDFNFKYNLIKQKINKSILACKTDEVFENIKHIYASLIILLYDDIDMDLIYSNNQLDALKKEGYILDKKINKVLK